MKRRIAWFTIGIWLGVELFIGLALIGRSQ